MVLKLIEEALKEFEEKKEMFLKGIKKVSEEYGVRCYLFGSRVKGTELRSSDLDVLVVIPSDKWNKKWEIYEKMKKACNDNPFVEIHIISEDAFEELRKLYEPLVPL